MQRSEIAATRSMYRFVDNHLRWYHGKLSISIARFKYAPKCFVLVLLD